jgi:hypothetical protein
MQLSARARQPSGKCAETQGLMPRADNASRNAPHVSLIAFHVAVLLSGGGFNAGSPSKQEANTQQIAVARAFPGEKWRSGGRAAKGPPSQKGPFADRPG